MIKLFGIAHNEEKSTQEIYNYLENNNPDCIALELSEDELEYPEKKYFNVKTIETTDNNNNTDNNNKTMKYRIIETLFFMIISILKPIFIIYSKLKTSEFLKEKDFKILPKDEFSFILEYLKYDNEKNIDIYFIDESNDKLRKMYITESTPHNIPYLMIKRFLSYHSTDNYHHFHDQVNIYREQKMIEKLIELDKKYNNIICILGEEHIDTVKKALEQASVNAEIEWRRFGKEEMDNKPWFMRV